MYQLRKDAEEGVRPNFQHHVFFPAIGNHYLAPLSLPMKLIYADSVLFCHPCNVSNLVQSFENEIESAVGGRPMFMLWSDVSGVPGRSGDCLHAGRGASLGGGDLLTRGCTDNVPGFLIHRQTQISQQDS